MNTIEQCTSLVKHIYAQFDASHDFQHIERVLATARTIAATEPTANLKIIELAVLLHDVSDAKYAASKAQQQHILMQLPLTDEERQHIAQTIAAVSYRGGHELPATTIEMKIVRDADRLDAIGAIGIARAFTFGGKFGSQLYNDDESAEQYDSEESYRAKNSSVVTHFYEKLLLLKDLMTTAKGKALAESRHQFMLKFLAQLQQEREGNV
jgi:uncharacterized protein